MLNLKSRIRINLLFLILGILSVLFKGCTKKEDTDTRTLKEKALFPVGAAATVSHLNESDFANAFKNNFSRLTAEYEMKMKEIWTSLAGYSFTKPDYLVNYALQNSLKLHGHTLLWYQSFPSWFVNAAYDSVNFENNVKTYIQAVVSRYKGNVAGWDVANEIFADNGSLRNDGIVYKAFKDPIAFYGRCFQYAHTSDPDAKLFYNDYDLVLNTLKREAVEDMIERFRSNGYPIDGIGEQLHTYIWASLPIIASGLTNLASTGLLIHISELDIRVNQNKSDSYIFTEADQQRQSDMCNSIVDFYETIPQAQKYGITTWGVTDKYTWLTSWWHPKEYPLLFDRNYAKKKAYYGFLSGLN